MSQADYEIIRQALVDQGFGKLVEEQPEVILALQRALEKILQTKDG